MKRRHYFIELTASYMPKNKAHKELQDFVRQYHKTLADEPGTVLIKSAIKQKLVEVNNEFKRCHNITLSGFIHENETVAVDGNFILVFKEVRSHEFSEPENWLVEHKPGVESNLRYYHRSFNNVLDNVMSQPDGDLDHYIIWKQEH